MDTERLDTLERLALAAAGHADTRPRKWEARDVGELGRVLMNTLPDGREWRIGEVDYTSTADFVAAADPETVLQLVARVRELEAKQVKTTLDDVIFALGRLGREALACGRNDAAAFLAVARAGADTADEMLRDDR